MRVIAPTELRESVIDVLRRDKGVTHVVVHRDAALDPLGDEVTADIAREAANDVIDDLKALGLKRRGAITLDVVDTVVSAAAYRAEKEAEGDPADAVIWDELAARTREESSLNVTYLTFLSLAGVRAAGRARGRGRAAPRLPRPAGGAGAAGRLPARDVRHGGRRARR